MRELPMTDNSSMDRLREEATEDKQNKQGQIDKDDARKIAENTDEVDTGKK